MYDIQDKKKKLKEILQLLQQQMDALKKEIDIFIDTKNKTLKTFIVKYQNEIERLLKTKSIYYDKN